MTYGEITADWKQEQFQHIYKAARLVFNSITVDPSLANSKLATQNHWVFGLFPLSGFLENRKRDVSETGSDSVLR
jgi:hypothetical protein